MAQTIYAGGPWRESPRRSQRTRRLETLRRCLAQKHCGRARQSLIARRKSVRCTSNAPSNTPGTDLIASTHKKSAMDFDSCPPLITRHKQPQRIWVLSTNRQFLLDDRRYTWCSKSAKYSFSCGNMESSSTRLCPTDVPKNGWRLLGHVVRDGSRAISLRGDLQRHWRQKRSFPRPSGAPPGTSSDSNTAPGAWRLVVSLILRG